MIWIFNLEKASACACDSYVELFQYLLKMEKLKLEDAEPTEVIGASDMGMPVFKKQWCLDYCKTNNYVVIETSPQTSQTPPQDISDFSFFAEVAPPLRLADGIL